MKIFKIIFIATLAIVSCQLEEDFQKIDNNAVPMTFYAGIELPEDHVETKTILGGSPSDKYRKVLWEADDEVYVTNETYSSKFINIAENGANLAILEGELSHGSKYLAAYPYDIVTDYTSGTFNVNLPTVQEYFEEGIDPGTFPMVAKCKNGTFNFQNICGIFVLQLLGEKTISALTFSGEGETGNLLSVAGNGSVSMGYDDYPTLNLNDSSSKTVKLNCSNGVALNNENPSLFHIILPDGTYHNFKVVVEATDGSIMTITSTKPLRIKRSTRTTAAELTYGDAIDLSEEGTANCYIVNNPGNYSFDASVKGNSSETVGSAETAEVLWESFGTEIQPEVGDVIKNAKYEDGKVKFDVPLDFKEGNAVIAVKDDSGKILWSWHIWVTDLPKEHVYPNNVSIVMDRNLGATSARPGDVTTHGLIYQWGRKDPFLGSVYDVDNEAKSTITWPAIHSSSVTTGTIEYTINNPTTFIEDNTINNDWYYNRGLSHTDNTRWGETKTIYDPCPLGWKVPNNEEIDMKSLSNQSYFDISYNGVNFNIANSENTWYPLTGYRIGTNGNFSSSGGEYWTTTTTSQKYAYTLKLEPYSSTQFKVYMDSAWKAYGYSVRCVKDNSVGNDSDIESSEIDIDSAIDLSLEGTANSYIVSSAGVYSIPTVKGNTLESVGNVVSIDVLWESFGTNESVSEGDLIAAAMYNNGKAYFKTNNVYRKGNAVIAARDASGIILWSWHIWLTDKPEEHIYYNNAGTLMDRNLGATSADAGNVTSQGLLYQWGRKDPFLGSSSIGEAKITRSTLDTWPTPEKSSELVGTIDYATNNPTTIIIKNDVNGDWLFSTTSTTDHSRWQAEKTMYDPCPNGWRVPDGGETGVWVSASELTSCDWKYDSDRHGMNFCKLFSDSSVWYPSISIINNASGKLTWFEAYNGYWSSTAASGDYSACTSYNMTFTDVNYMSKKAYAYPLSSAEHGDGLAVRCMKEGTSENSQTNIIDLSASGTANSYIISEGGAYKFKAVQGNSSTSVGSVSSTEVLWESFGTDIAPIVGDLVNSTTFLNDYIYITIPETFVEGNAVVAAKDASGTVLWSWHIWLTDKPEEQEYYNNAGTVMDRNLGATSATPGDVGALGLVYQWGRKDPFLIKDYNNYYSDFVIHMLDTGEWSVNPDLVDTVSIDYTTQNPMTYLPGRERSYDCFYCSTLEYELWQSTTKTIYDPCPKGWIVSSSELWKRAMDGHQATVFELNYNMDFEGVDLARIFGDAPHIWYPFIEHKRGTNWSSTHNENNNHWLIYYFDWDDWDDYYTVVADNGQGDPFKLYSVRCVKE